MENSLGTSKVRKFQDFLNSAHFFFKWIGTIPYESLNIIEYNKYLVETIFYIGIINLNIHLLAVIGGAVVGFQVEDNVLEAVQACSHVGFISVSEFKIFSFWWKKKVLIKFVSELKNLFPTDPVQQKMYDLETYYKHTDFITKLLSITYTVLVTVYNFFVLFRYLIGELLLGFNKVEVELPYVEYIPWDYKGNWSYYLIYITQALAGFTASGQIIASDLLFCSLTIQVTMHYKYLSKRFRSYQVHAGKNRLQCYKDYEFIKEIVIYHNTMLNLSSELNDIFNITLLFNFMISSCIICFLAFLITMGVETAVLMKLMLYLVCSLLQVYLICYLGHQLTDASGDLTLAVYEHKWYDADPKYKKMCFLIVERAKKPFVLHASYFVQISRETITLIIQISFKFLTLLRTIYE